MDRRARLGALWLAAVVLLIYLPDLGRGFLKDDFAWIRSSRLEHAGDLWRYVSQPASGFFRPLVALSFGIDDRLFGLHALGYGLTNLALVGLCAAGVWRLAVAFGLHRVTGLIAAALWSLNFHGINMAVLWISGRTALLLCAAATWAAAAVLAGRPILAGGLTLLALFAKEEAVALPVIFAAWLALRRDGGTLADRLRTAAAGTWPAFAALAVYVALRSRTGAMTFATAPAFYQARLDPGHVAWNVLEYLDRSSTLAAAIALVAWLTAGRRLGLDDREKQVIRLAAIWVAGTFAITVWLPVRSSLYACTPAAGSALIAAIVVSDAWGALTPPGRRRALVAAMILPLALWPVYHARNQRLANEARLSAAVMRTLAPLGDAAPPIGGLVFVDDQRARPSLYQAFGPHLPDAVALAIGRPIPVSLDNTPDAGLSHPTPDGPTTRRFRLENSRLIDTQ